LGGADGADAEVECEGGLAEAEVVEGAEFVDVVFGFGEELADLVVGHVGGSMVKRARASSSETSFT
jgi:hypothetical protein